MPGTTSLRCSVTSKTHIDTPASATLPVPSCRHSPLSPTHFGRRMPRQGWRWMMEYVRGRERKKAKCAALTIRERDEYNDGKNNYSNFIFLPPFSQKRREKNSGVLFFVLSAPLFSL